MKKKTDFPLHLAIKFGREDVVFLYLIDHDLDIHARMNEADKEGNFPLHLALLGGHESIANSLVGGFLKIELRSENSYLWFVYLSMPHTFDIPYACIHDHVGLTWCQCQRTLL